MAIRLPAVALVHQDANRKRTALGRAGRPRRAVTKAADQEIGLTRARTVTHRSAAHGQGNAYYKINPIIT